MKPRLRTIGLAFLIGIGFNLAAAVVIAQFSDRPPCSLAYAQSYATSRIFKEPRPTPPIWPDFSVQGRGISIDGVNPEESSVATSSLSGMHSNTEGFITVTVRVGWPMYCLRMNSQYTNGGWTDSARSLQLAARKNKGKSPLARELPLGIIWTGLLLNSLLLPAAIGLPYWCVLVPRQLWRRCHHQCLACGYPIGQSPVCTECGVEVNAHG